MFLYHTKARCSQQKAAEQAGHRASLCVCLDLSIAANFDWVQGSQQRLTLALSRMLGWKRG